MQSRSFSFTLFACVALLNVSPSFALTEFDTDRLTIPRSEILSGGPGKDGIPALTHPRTIPVGEAGDFAADERVVVVRLGGETRAYPLSILNWHEVVNETIGRTPFAVVYCPLCDSVSVVDRRIDGETLEFGVSGRLYQSNVLLYDRTHDALWSQVGLTAVSGPYAGRALLHLPWEIMPMQRLREQHPEARVLSPQTGHRRDYARNPYDTYFKAGRLSFPITRIDTRLRRMDPVIGIRIGELTRAYPISRIQRQKDGRLVDEFGDERLVLEAGKDGSIAVVEHPAAAQVVHTFWFAWATLQPDTEIYAPKGRR